MDIFDEFRYPSSMQPAPAVTTDSDRVKQLLNKLEGYKTKIKNLHWSAKLLPYKETQELHEDLDDVLTLISEFQDAIAENYMGSFGDLPIGFLNGIQPETNDPLEVIEGIMTELRGFHATYSDSVSYIGMINATEDLLQQLPVKKYLISLCK